MIHETEAKTTGIETLNYDVGGGKVRNIYIGSNILEELPTYAGPLAADKFFIISDTEVDGRLKKRVKGILAGVAETHLICFPAGESSKTLATLETAAAEALDAGATKSSVIVCLGGGVVGNLGGLLAALLFRGIRFFHVPTTMVAQIDSAIGIKQAVNYRKGKNLFGQYYAPEFVFIDFDTIRTLPERHIKAGIAESIKHGLCQDIEFFDYIGRHAPNYSWEVVERIARRTIELKLELLKFDPLEGKLDPQLELGHTIGHALEIIVMGRFLHGEAIAIGMVVEARISCAMGFMEEGLCRKIENIFSRVGLPTRIPEDVSADQIIEILKYDNKRKTAKNDFFLLEDFTRFHRTDGNICTKVPEAVLREVVASCY